MKLNGPYVTLAGGLAVAGVLLSLSATAVKKDQDLSSTPVAAAGEATATQEATDEDAAATDEDAEANEDDAEATPEESTAAPKPSATAAAKPAPSGTYAGSVKGGGASIAIAIKGDTAIAYVCDGKKVEAWMQGDADAAALKLTGKGGAAVNAKYTGGHLSGTISTAGKKWTFKVKTVKAPSGLYRASKNVRNAKVVGGWIVYEGEQVGMLNTDGTETPAPPIDLTTRTVTIDGTTVTTDVVDGAAVPD